MVLSFIVGQTGSNEDLLSILESFAKILSESVSFVEFNTGPPYSKMIDGNVGLAAEVDGMWGENPIAGRIVVVAPSEGLVFYALAFSSSNPNTLTLQQPRSFLIKLSTTSSGHSLYSTFPLASKM